MSCLGFDFVVEYNKGFVLLVRQGLEKQGEKLEKVAVLAE